MQFKFFLINSLHFFISLTITLCYNCTAPPHLWMPIISPLVRQFKHKVSPALSSDSPLHPEAKHRDITCHWIEVKSWIIPRAAESEIMRQPNYADNCVAVSPLCSVSDTDKCLFVAAQAALATFSERQRSVTAEGDRVLLLLRSGLRQMSNNR